MLPSDEIGAFAIACTNLNRQFLLLVKARAKPLFVKRKTIRASGVYLESKIGFPNASICDSL